MVAWVRLGPMSIALNDSMQSLAAGIVMKDRQRRRLFVDPKVQGALLIRAVMYWGFSLMAVTIMLLCWRIFTGPARAFWTHFDDMWFQFGSAFVASLLLLPLVIMDAVRISNRFCGPVVRLRSGLRSMGRGEEVGPLHFRETDCWSEMADDFNAVRARIDRLERELADARAHAAELEPSNV